MTELRVTEGRCQFCHRTASDVGQLVAGDSAFICDDCVRACAALLESGSAAATDRADVGDRFLHQRLSRHFAPWRPQEMISTSRTFPMRQQADLQLALDELLGERIVPQNFVGVHQQYQHDVLSFAKLLEQNRGAAEIAPAQYEDVEVGVGESVRCLKNGLWLMRDGDDVYAVLLARTQDFGMGSDVVIEVGVPPGEPGVSLCARVFDAIESKLSKASCYRGKVLSLEQPYQYSGRSSRIAVHHLDAVSRDEVILPESTLGALERNVLRFADQREALRALGLSTQKGLLFHGAPGTGKTHCIRYLASRLRGHTTLLITAEQVGLLPEYMALARLLQPALVVIEDADLIARERTERDTACDEVMLNRLLNEMDGLRERADVFFVLTTNRPDALEPALANRPGRIDQAIEFPLPDEGLRMRLIVLYARDVPLPPAIVTELARRTDGTSPAFIKELLRRIAQHHLDAGGDGDVSRETAEAALREMLFSGGALNSHLLGGAAAVT
jgi:ATPase family associated with various cellular activities (AAA)/ClpX C4-type zinc finger